MKIGTMFLALGVVIVNPTLEIPGVLTWVAVP